VIRIMWETADTEMRDVIGPLFAEFIVAFQAPDLVAEAGWLEAVGFDPARVKKIIDETYEATDLVSLHRKQAVPTISMMRGFRMLDHPSTYDAVAHRGWSWSSGSRPRPKDRAGAGGQAAPPRWIRRVRRGCKEYPWYNIGGVLRGDFDSRRCAAE
jgi:hypothetical protein